MMVNPHRLFWRALKNDLNYKEHYRYRRMGLSDSDYFLARSILRGLRHSTTAMADTLRKDCPNNEDDRRPA